MARLPSLKRSTLNVGLALSRAAKLGVPGGQPYLETESQHSRASRLANSYMSNNGSSFYVSKPREEDTVQHSNAR